MTDNNETAIGVTEEYVNKLKKEVPNLNEAVTIFDQIIAQEVCNCMVCLRSPLRERIQELAEKRMELILNGLNGGKDE